MVGKGICPSHYYIKEKKRAAMNQFERTYANQQDAFSLLYYYLAQSVCQKLGPDEGKTVVRRALEETGTALGTKFRDLHTEQELNTNLTTLFNPGYGIPRDPRVWDCDQEWYEESRIWEVYTCPMAQLWEQQDPQASALGALYCACYYPALLKAYTQGLASIELSHCLASGDDCCHLAAALPSAGMDGQQKWACFGHKDGPEDKDFQPTDFSEYICSQMLAFTKALCEAGHTDAVTRGLKAFAQALTEEQRIDLPLPDGEEIPWPSQALQQLFTDYVLTETL